jgi:hypothetical protein
MNEKELAAQFKAYYALFKSTLKNEGESPFEEVDDKYLRIDFARPVGLPGDVFYRSVAILPHRV